MTRSSLACGILLAGIAVCHAVRTDTDEDEHVPILPPIGLLTQSKKGPSIAKVFSDGMVKDYVTVIRKKQVIKEEKKTDKLVNPLDAASIGLRVSLMTKNKYVKAKLSENSNDMYKAAIVVISNLCADATNPEQEDDCNGFLHELVNPSAKKECRDGFWTCQIMPLEHAMLPFVEQERAAKTPAANAELALALIHLYKTHHGAVQALEAYNKMLESIKFSRTQWQKLTDEMKTGLSDPALRRAFLAQCRVVPSILGIEDTAHPLDCLERMDDVVHHVKSKDALCLALGGPNLWDRLSPPIEKVNKALDFKQLSEAECDQIIDQEWSEESLKPTQDLLACAAVVPGDKEPPVPWTKPHLTFPTSDKGQRTLQYVFRADNPTQATYPWESTKTNVFSDKEKELVGAWKRFSQSITEVTGACEEPSVSIAEDGETQQMAVPLAIKEACEVTSKAVEKLTEKAIATLGTSSEDLSSSEAHLFMKSKELAKTEFLKLLQVFRADEYLFEEVQKEKEKAKTKTPETKKGGMPLPPPGLLLNPKAKKRDFAAAQRVPAEQLDVWKVVDRVVKLWRVLFDVSRRDKKYTTGGASFLFMGTRSPSLSRKCAMLPVCMDLPNQLKTLDAEIQEKKAEAKKKKKKLKSFCQQQDLCLTVRTFWQDCTKSTECPPPDPKSLGASKEVLWCEKSMEGMIAGMKYGATENGIELTDSCDVTVQILDDDATSVVSEFKSSDVQKRWLQPLSVVATCKCSA